MSILNIGPATREGAHLLIQLFGGPRSGKTRTALRLARGIAGPTGKIAVIDTEAGRARLYADKIEGGFFVGDLTPPFTPRRYRDAIEEFVAFGADVLIVDSFSHCWNGPGGVLEMADQGEANGKKGLQKWLAPKTEYRKLVGFLLSTSIHIIFCSRGKQPVVEQMVDGRKTMVTLPWEPIQDRLLKYEMTIVLPMTLDGGYETDPMRMKAPDDLAHLFTGELLTEATGAAIGAWVSGGAPIDHAGELLRKRANDAAIDGSDAFRDFWKGLNKDQRDVLRASMGNLQSIAETADAEQKAREDTEREIAERADPSLDAPFGRQESPPASETPAPSASTPAAEHPHSAPADAEEDAFGLRPLDTTSAHDAPSRSPAASQPTERKVANGFSGPPTAPTGERIESTAPDLLGDPPAENLTVSLSRDHGEPDYEFYARQMLSMIAERPGDVARLVRIKTDNENNMLKLKAGAVELYDEVQAALTAARRAT